MLLHSGDLHSGHYFILIKQDRDILDGNYGGEPLGRGVPRTQRNQVRAIKRFTNAYT